MEPAERDWYKAAAESSFDAMIRVRPDGTVAGWNPAAERIYGYSAAEARSRPVAALLGEEDGGPLTTMLARLEDGGAAGVAEASHRRSDGSPVEVMLTVAPVHDTRERVVGALVMVRDLTEQRHAVRQLTQEQERLWAALWASRIGTFRWNVRQDIFECDDNLRGLFGLDRDTPVRCAQDFLDRVHPEDRDALRTRMQECIDTGETFTAEFRIVTPDGAVRWLADQAEIIPGDDGRPLFFTGACRDVTTRRQTEEELASALRVHERLLEQKDVLLREVNHRVKNSLQLVSSLLGLQARADMPEAIRRHLVEARDRVGMVARVHERLYQTGRFRSVDLGQFVTELCTEIARSAGLGGPTAKVVVDTEPLEVPTDRAIPLALVLNELLTNALKYAYPGETKGVIRVALVTAEPGHLRLTVEDEGIGLPADFDRLLRASLGMRLVAALVQQLRGKLSIPPRRAGAAFVVACATGEVRDQE